MVKAQLQVFCRNQVGEPAPALFRVCRKKGMIVVEDFGTKVKLEVNTFTAGSGRVLRALQITTEENEFERTTILVISMTAATTVQLVTATTTVRIVTAAITVQRAINSKALYTIVAARVYSQRHR